MGHGVVESKVDSGNLLKHPWKRARTTFQYIAVAIIGNPQDRAAFREAVNTAHRHVKSAPDSPVPYNAFDRDLQMWVAACLFVGLEDTYQLLRGEMTAEQSEQFYRSAWTLGTTLQVSEDQWPPTRAEFDAYWTEACGQVAIDDHVRDYLLDLLNLHMINPVLGLPFRPLLKFLTVGFLAPVFREAMGVRWSDFKQTLVRKTFPDGRFGQQVPAGVRPPGRQLRPAGRRSTTGASTESVGLNMLRRLLSRRVSVEAMLEFAMWMAIPYLLIGLVWAFFDAEQVQLLEAALQSRLPAGSEVLAFVQTALMWPNLMLGADICVA